MHYNKYIYTQVSYLNLRLHGILVNFDIKLGPKFDEHTQQSALASLAVLIRYMGATYLTPLRYKILATLRTSLGFKRPGFPSLVCEAWDAFIHKYLFTRNIKLIYVTYILK